MTKYLFFSQYREKWMFLHVVITRVISIATMHTVHYRSGGYNRNKIKNKQTKMLEYPVRLVMSFLMRSLVQSLRKLLMHIGADVHLECEEVG